MQSDARLVKVCHTFSIVLYVQRYSSSVRNGFVPS